MTLNGQYAITHSISEKMRFSEPTTGATANECLSKVSLDVDAPVLFTTPDAVDGVATCDQHNKCGDASVRLRHNKRFAVFGNYISRQCGRDIIFDKSED